MRLCATEGLQRRGSVMRCDCVLQLQLYIVMIMITGVVSGGLGRISDQGQNCLTAFRAETRESDPQKKLALPQSW